MDKSASPFAALDASLAIILRSLIRVYQWVSFAVPHRCRFIPSCSKYIDQSLAARGFFRGLPLGLGRLLRCHPWNPGGYDPVNN